MVRNPMPASKGYMRLLFADTDRVLIMEALEMPNIETVLSVRCNFCATSEKLLRRCDCGEAPW